LKVKGNIRDEKMKKIVRGWKKNWEKEKSIILILGIVKKLCFGSEVYMRFF
jgi:hypothetical protein